MGKWIKISVGKWISIAAIAVTMLWIGLVGTAALNLMYSADSNLPSWFIFLPLFLSVVAVGLFLFFEGGAISRFRRNRRTTRGDASDQNPAVSRKEIDRILKEGDEWIANYKETLSELTSKRRYP